MKACLCIIYYDWENINMLYLKIDLLKSLGTCDRIEMRLIYRITKLIT